MIPTYRKHSPLQNYLDLRRDTLGFLSSVVKACGDFTRVDVLVWRFYLVNDPALIREALADKSESLIIRGGVSAGLARLIGDGILTNRGEDWRRSRAQLQPLFHQAALRSYLSTMEQRVQETLDRWRTTLGGQPIPLHREFHALSFRIKCSTLFGQLPSWEDALAFADAVWVLQGEGMQRHLDGGDYAPWLPSPRNRRVNHARAVLYRLATQAAAQGVGPAVDEVLSVLFAGTESPVNTLCFALKLLEEHPAWHQKVAADLAAQGPVSLQDDVEKFDPLAQVLSECIRLYPAGWAFERWASEDVELGGERIARGSRLLFSPYLMHRNARFWREPDRFDPTRFSQGPNSADGVPKYGYMPYGAGPRSCIGSRLAQLEMRIALRMLVEQCTWKTERAAGEPPVDAEGSFKIRLSRPMLMRMEFPPSRIPRDTPATTQRAAVA